LRPVLTNPELERVPARPRPEVSPEADGDRREIVARLEVLWENRRSLFRAAVCGLIIATLIAFLIPKQFESTTRLMPPDDSSGAGMAVLASLSGKGGGLGSLAGDMLGVKSTGDLFVGVLKSRTVQDDVIQKIDLRKVYGQSRWEDARRELASNTSISQDRKSGIITITVTDRDARRAATLAQQYLESLNGVVNQVSTSSARRERIFLEGRLQQVKQDLELAEKDFSEFASKTGAIDVKEQGKAMLTAAAGLQGEMIAAQSQLEGLRQIYTDNNVRVRSLKARVAELRAQLDKVGGRQDVFSDVVNPDAGNSGAATTKDDSLYPSIRKLPLLGVTYADLYRRSKVQEAVFETLTQEYELAKVREAKEIPSVKVLDSPNLPERKSFPPRLAIMFLGAVFALLMAGAWVLGRERWEATDPLDPRKQLAAEVFHAANATMPWAQPNGSRFQAATHRVWTRYVVRNGSSGKPESPAPRRP
jgi:capsule polysaccharide export protein KpsE/RkpR